MMADNMRRKIRLGSEQLAPIPAMREKLAIKFLRRNYE
jgi:hypothetical protein